MCSCARDCLATRHENTLYLPRTYLVVCFSIWVRFIIYRIFVPRIALPVLFSRAHARAVHISKTIATTGGVLLEASVARVPLGAAATVAATAAASECSCARDCLAAPCSRLSRARCA